MRPGIAPCGECPCDENGRRPYKAWALPGLIETSRCPRKHLEEDDPHQVWTWIELYDHWKSGYLPYAGGFLDQPAVFNDAMRLVQQRVDQSLETDDGHNGKGRR